MQTKKLISFYFQSFTFAELAHKAQKVHDGLAASAVYINPPVALPAFQTAIDELYANNIRWGVTGNRGSHFEYVTLLQSQRLVREILRKMANYCMSITPNDELELLNAGFEISRERTKAGVCGAVSELIQYKKGNIPDRAIKLRWVRPTLALPRENITYEVMRSADPDFDNAIFLGRVTKTTYMDLIGQGGVIFYYWVVPVNSAGKGRVSSICRAATSII